MNRKKAILLLTVIFAAALLLRLIPAVIAAGFPERLCRPDTPTYLEPAKAMLEGRFSGTGRAPGYSWLAAGMMWISCQYHILLLAIAGAVFSTLTLVPVYCCTKKFAGRSAGMIAAALLAFNITAMANAPMLLSDTLFGFFAAWQCCFFLYFYRRKELKYFFLCILTAAAGTLIRPINLPWIAPALVMLWLMPGVAWQRKITASLGGILIFFALITPWMARNAASGAPWCIDTNTGAMLHQNGAMILAEANNTSYEKEKRSIIAEYDRIFKDSKRFPDERSREEWKIAQLRKIIFQHPFIAVKQHFNWHNILLPDAPALFEIAGLTQSDRGTMDVLKRKGLLAAVNHYFEGRWYLPLSLGPLLAVTAMIYLGTIAVLIWSLFHFRRRWYLWLLFLGLAEFYLFMPGPICAPRYQIPALPLMCMFAGAFTVMTAVFLRHKIRNKQ
ncbi:MAG: glycosyltransferase family 39 protein [Lentisphaeria bacterium]|nr:glycosyltransferase family 39 protein [Lentisphaeria bacterium]